MKTAFEHYQRKIESRALLFIKKAKTDHNRFYPIALELCAVVGDFTGEDRWDAYDRIQNDCW